MSKIKLLLAEDEPALGQIIKESLETRDFEVTHCLDGESAFKTFKKNIPDILVIDVMMPVKDGFTVVKEIRTFNKEVPIIFLTSKSQATDVVQGFKSGANDYLKKPFSIEELIARINNLVSRSITQKTLEVVTIGKFSLNLPKQELSLRNDIVRLTHREAHLLYNLARHKNDVLDRSLILKKLWGDDDFFSARSMDVFITKLRKKLKEDPNVSIVNVRGYGYKLIC